MEPTEPLFAIIAKIVLIIIFAIIPFVFGIFVNISTKHRKAFLIAGRVVSILSAIFIAVILTVGTLYATEDSYEVRPFYIYACYFCGLTIAFLPLSTFYFITCQKTKKRKACYLTISFIAFFLILSGLEFLFNRAYGFAFETERQELSINDFYTNNPEADKNSDINLHIFIQDWGSSGKCLIANISVYKDSITLKTEESCFSGNNTSETNSCYRNDLPRDLVQDIIEEITYYQPEIEYTWVGDLCFHPFAFVELANNKNATTIILKLPDIDECHPNAQRLAKKIASLVNDSKIDPTKGCSN